MMGEAAEKGKEKWPLVRLGDVAKISSGGTPSRSNPEYWDNGIIPWVKIGDIDGKYINETEESITESGLNNSSAKKFPKGTLLYTIFATLGEVSILNIDAATNQAIAGIQFDDSVNTDYAYYFLLSLQNIVKNAGRGVAQNNINQTILKNIQIPLPPLPEQRRIAAVLDQVSSLIALRKAQLAKLDLLVKARFVEMFGDPVKNEMGWNRVSLDEIAEISSGITKGRKTKEQDLKKVPYLSVSNVKDGYIDVSHVKTILATQNEIKQYKLLPYDVLMTEGGDPDKLGRGAILYQPPENCIHQNHIFRVRFDKNKINPVFFEEYLKHPAAKKYFLKCAKQTTGIATINMKQLNSLPVLLPPLEHQHVFSQFKQNTIKLKLAYNQTLEKLEILMKSLSLEYFG